MTTAIPTDIGAAEWARSCGRRRQVLAGGAVCSGLALVSRGRWWGPNLLRCFPAPATCHSNAEQKLPRAKSLALPKPMPELKKLLGDQELSPTTVQTLTQVVRNRAVSSLSTVLMSDDAIRAVLRPLIRGVEIRAPAHAGP